MPNIELYELGPSRSLKVRWALQEAGLAFNVIGDSPEILGSDALRRVHPLGKVPAVVIDGQPLFESSAIVAAIADLVPEQNLIAKQGSWERHLHDQWSYYALTELEACAWHAVLNTAELVFPKDRHLPAAINQDRELFDRNVPALTDRLSQSDHIMGAEFTVTDINVVYPLHLANILGWLSDYPVLQVYFERLKDREHSTLT